MAGAQLDLRAVAVEPENRKRRLIHEVSQPLNVISLAVANLRNVLGEGLSPEQLVYLDRKLDRIDQQAERVRAILEGLPG
jgi:signal transduction histidine kinase